MRLGELRQRKRPSHTGDDDFSDTRYIFHTN